MYIKNIQLKIEGEILPKSRVWKKIKNKKGNFIMEKPDEHYHKQGDQG